MDEDEVIFAFHRYVKAITPDEVSWWTRAFPQHADAIREHAVELIDMSFRAEHRPERRGSSPTSVTGPTTSIRECATCFDQPKPPMDCPSCGGSGSPMRKPG